MRIALCLSGHMRTYRQTSWSLKRLLLHDPRHHFDIFIHTWDSLGWFDKIDGSLMSKDFTKEVVAIRRIYKPVVLSVETPLSFDTTNFPIRSSFVKDGTRGEHIFSMFYKIKMCHETFRVYAQSEKVRYDLVIRSRADIMHESPLPLDNVITPNTIFTHQLGHVGGMNDQIAWGSPESMDIYASCFDHLRQYVAEGCYWRPEALLYHHLHRSNVKVVPLDFRYYLQRGNGQMTLIRSSQLGTHYRSST